MTEKDFIPASYSKELESGSVTYQSPSNIALVKYWGKHGQQLPQNASVSFTLNHCRTTTTLFFEPKADEAFEVSVLLDGVSKPDFEPKILQFFERVETYLPLLRKYRFRIETTNSFPHSSGIASSASGMSALSMCLMDMEQQLLEHPMSDDRRKQKASFISRLGSGSASRSIEGPIVLWGTHPDVSGSSDLFGIPYHLPVHPIFAAYKDTILLVDKGEKQVSSSVGHNLMHDHAYAQRRFNEANANISRLAEVFEAGDLTAFIEIVESEALQLHAMMMTSIPYFILMKPNTLEIINRIWAFRKETSIPVCFTLDAGANVHVLYPDAHAAAVDQFIKADLASYCKNGEFIQDQTGFGASAVI
ncbi:MAG: diphosphomevalonate decarboxylase [Bacteroidota bacterium]